MIDKGNFMGLGVYVKRGEKMKNLQTEIDKAVNDNKTFIFKADTIEKLAQKMKIPSDKFSETIDSYNNSCKLHNDREFGKDSKYLIPVNHGPYYGFELNIGAFCTMGGLQVTPNNEVLNQSGRPIIGLFAAGNDASGLAGDTYGPNMPGTCVGYAFYSGRKAGQGAAKLAVKL
jgi:fumarate reductase flavoprotein subunit